MEFICFVSKSRNDIGTQTMLCTVGITGKDGTSEVPSHLCSVCCLYVRCSRAVEVHVFMY